MWPCNVGCLPVDPKMGREVKLLEGSLSDLACYWAKENLCQSELRVGNVSLTVMTSCVALTFK